MCVVCIESAAAGVAIAATGWRLWLGWAIKILSYLRSYR